MYLPEETTRLRTILRRSHSREQIFHKLGAKKVFGYNLIRVQDDNYLCFSSEYPLRIDFLLYDINRQFSEVDLIKNPQLMEKAKEVYERTELRISGMMHIARKENFADLDDFLLVVDKIVSSYRSQTTRVSLNEVRRRLPENKKQLESKTFKEYFSSIRMMGKKILAKEQVSSVEFIVNKSQWEKAYKEYNERRPQV